MKTHLLLDIEGTTCPFNFIVDVLFPYAEQNLEPFIDSHCQEDSITKILANCILTTINTNNINIKNFAFSHED